MLEASGVSVRYGNRLALDNVNLTVRGGELVVVCGPNGAGKSTLLAALTGDARLVAGDVQLAGHSLSGQSPADLALGRAVLEQSPNLSVAFTVAELASLGLPQEISPADAAALTQDVLTRLDLHAFRHRPVPELSGGERHRVHLARVLVQLEAGRRLGRGHALFLDEPTASLDIAHQVTVMRQALHFARRGVGVFVVLHDLNLASAFADRIVLLSAGLIAADGSPSDVLTAAQLGQIYGISFTAEPGPMNRPRVIPDYHLRQEVADIAWRNERLSTGR